MSENDQKPIDALSISLLGRAFDQRLREETGQLDKEIARQAADAADVVRKIEALFELAEHKVGHVAGALAATEAERERIAGDLSAVREALEAQRAEQARLREANVALERVLADAVAKADAAVARYDEASKELAGLHARCAAAQGNAAAAIERADSFARNARARESMLQEAIAQVRLDEGLKAIREKVRAEHLTAQLALVSRSAQGISGVAELLSTDSRALVNGDTIRAAVAWLAENGEKYVGTAPDSRFEALAGQTLDDQVFIAAAYLWILGRPVDDDGAAHYARLLSESLTRADMLANLASSGEGAGRIALICEGLGPDDDAAIAAAYKLILGRPVDAAGAAHYRSVLARKNGRRMLLSDLASSREGRLSGTPLAAAVRVHHRLSLPSAIVRRRLSKALGRPSVETLWAWHAGRLGVLASAAAQRAREIEARIDTIEAEAHRPPVQHDPGVKAPTAQDREQASGGRSPASAMAKTLNLALLLSDSAEIHTPASIRAAIRAELEETEKRS